jgi:hypothetical protein
VQGNPGVPDISEGVPDQMQGQASGGDVQYKKEYHVQGQAREGTYRKGYWLQGQVGVPHVAEGVYQVQGQKGLPGVNEGVPGAGIGGSTRCTGRWTDS